MKRKNVLITDYDYFGRGISKIDGKVCFVKAAKKGFQGTCRVTKETKKYLEACLEEKDYETVDCPYFYACGGCQLRHLSQQEQLAFKCDKVKALLKRNAGLDVACLPIQKTPFLAYRNKATFHLENGQVGYYQEETHHVLAIDTCLLLSPRINEVIKELQLFAKQNPRKMEATVRTLQDEVLLDLKEEKTHPMDFDFQTVDTFYYQNQLLKGKKHLEGVVDKTHFEIAKDAFFQVNLQGFLQIIQILRNHLSRYSCQKVLDLYCGVGAISLLIAPFVKEVFGVEVVPSAIENAKSNQKKNHLTNVSFLCGKVEEVLSHLPKGYDTVIVDPPRRGLDAKTKRFLKETAFPTFFYISCDPATLTRDIKELSEVYQLDAIELVDMFPNTYHVECVCALRRRP